MSLIENYRNFRDENTSKTKGNVMLGIVVCKLRKIRDVKIFM